MQRLKFSLTIGAFFLMTSTTTFLLQAQEPRDWTNFSGVVVLKSGVLEVDRTLKELEDGTPEKVYVRVDAKLKYFQFDKLGAEDRSYVRQELGLPMDVEDQDYSLSEEPTEPSMTTDFEKSDSSSDDWSGTFQAGDRKTLTFNGVEFAFRYCPAGTFMMGSPEDEEGRDGSETQKKVMIGEGFWICETETTQEQWDSVGVKKRKKCGFKGAKLPVEMVSWNESVEFIQQLNKLNITPKGWRFELPTEEQWEYACRAGTTGTTYGVPLDECAWYRDNSDDETQDVGTKTANQWGIYDMLGNVCEWTSTSTYRTSFVVRGGGWCGYARCFRPASRISNRSAERSDNIGFRCVLVRSQSE